MLPTVRKLDCGPPIGSLVWVRRLLVTLLLEKLPTILVLAVLVGIFISLRKHSTSERMRLWIFAWALIFLHFCLQVFETRTGVIEGILESIDLGALELAGVVFLVSMTTGAEDRLRRTALLLLLGVPTAFHAVAVTFDWHVHWVMAAALAVIFCGVATLPLLLNRKVTLLHASLMVLLIGVGSWAVYFQLHGNADPGVHAILALSFALCGLLFWRRFPRYSLGVITVAGGFLCWGAVFPAGALMEHFYPNVKVNPELWNVPKFFVAFGMILSVLEEKTRIIEQSSLRKHAENALLQRFSRITSRLLAGKDPAALCGEIAAAIIDSANFRRAAIFLSHADGALFLVGSSGYSIEDCEALRERASHWTVGMVQEQCAAGTRLGNNSFCVRSNEIAGNEARLDPGSDAAACEHSDGVLVPMISSRGAHLGCLLLSAPKDAAPLDSSEMMKLEMLAADLAVTLENNRLHHQLVRSEKLAALGQLVAGVAHELNNPLTGIIGYTELLSEEVENEGALRRLGKLGSEARRMKRIVDGLLRFGRQNSFAARATNLEAALRDSIQLREYHLRKLNIQIHTELEPMLPQLAIGEDELKQIMLNLLSNAVDAVEESTQKSILIHAGRQGDRVVIRFEDSGPGFVDVNRALDPFYTTKPVGKGTGLGLSICYGIAHEHGGEIHIANKKPCGASVVVELPVTPQPVSVPAPA